MTFEININDVITDASDEAGAFNVFMETAKKYLKAEYDQNRIDKKDYAQVYLGSLEASMDRAIQFVLAKDRLQLELELLDIQKDTALIERQKVENERDFILAQISKMEEEELLVKANVKQADAQTNLFTEKRTTEKKEHLFYDYKIKTERANTDSAVISSNSMLYTARANTIAQTELYVQKKATEKAQVSSTGVSSTSLLGRQATLYKTQTDGFLRDAEQNAAKIALNTWSVNKSVSGDGIRIPSTLNESGLNNFVAKLYNGIK